MSELYKVVIEQLGKPECGKETREVAAAMLKDVEADNKARADAMNKGIALISPIVSKWAERQFNPPEPVFARPMPVGDFFGDLMDRVRKQGEDETVPENFGGATDEPLKVRRRRSKGEPEEEAK